MSIKIEKNVPVPTAGKGMYGRIIRQMELNDSVFVTSQTEMTSMRNALTYHGFKALSRKEGKGWRIWKLNRDGT